VDPVEAVPIRAATAADEEAVVALLQALHAEGGQAPLSLARVIVTVRDVLDRGAVLVVEERGRLIGTTGLLTEAPWFSEHAWVHELWTYVAPEARKRPVARALLRMARRYAEALRLPLHVTIAPGARMAAKFRLYRRELGDPSGATWTL
jgi:GNAT superfamily N-acetyltransferase